MVGVLSALKARSASPPLDGVRARFRKTGSPCLLAYIGRVSIGVVGGGDRRACAAQDWDQEWHELITPVHQRGHEGRSAIQNGVVGYVAEGRATSLSTKIGSPDRRSYVRSDTIVLYTRAPLDLVGKVSATFTILRCPYASAGHVPGMCSPAIGTSQGQSAHNCLGWHSFPRKKPNQPFENRPYIQDETTDGGWTYAA